MSLVTSLLYGVYVVLCLLMLLVILLQKGSEEDLGGAFGGGGGATDSLLGAKGDSTLKKITSVFAACFFLLAILIGVLELKQRRHTSLENKNKKKTKQVFPAKDKGKKKASVTVIHTNHFIC